jgi:hypothetical protein
VSDSLGTNASPLADIHREWQQRPRDLRDDLLHHAAALQAGEADAATAADDGEVFVIETEQVQDRGMQIAEVDRAIDDVLPSSFVLPCT